MNCLPSFACGVQGLLDQQLGGNNYKPVYLRMRNFAPTEPIIDSPAAQLGFSVPASDGGTTDYLINPLVAYQAVSMFNIGNSGGKLRFGARKFQVSNTFVRKIMTTYPAITHEREVWEGRQTVGLVTDGLLFSIEGIYHDAVSGQPVMWFLTANSNEQK